VAGDEIERFWHEVERMTVGQLRDAIQDLPDDMVLRVEVAFGPSTSHPDPWGNDQYVVTAAAVDDGEHLHADELVVRVDYPTDWYVRRTRSGPSPA
jgi:Family of unknown function (DUF6225)